MNIRRFQALNGKFNIQKILLYHIMKLCRQKLYLYSPGPVYVYSRAVKKDHYKRLLHVYFTALLLLLTCMQIYYPTKNTLAVKKVVAKT